MSSTSPRFHIVTFLVPEDLLSSVLAVLNPQVRLLSVKPQDPPPEAPPPASRTHHYQNGKRNKGIKGEDLVFTTLALSTVPTPRSKLEDSFKSHGFSPNSLSPIISKLKTTGLISEPSPNHFFKTPGPGVL